MFFLEKYQPLDQLFKQGANLINQGVIQAPPSPYIQPQFGHNLRFRNSIKAGVAPLSAPVPQSYYAGQPTPMHVSGQMPMGIWPYSMNPSFHPGFNGPYVDPTILVSKSNFETLERE